ncbi:MAG: hypothetical protein HKM95_14795 [Inquilinus sp.]|nr:hypothetical protein [Inquilinus sp.]
MVDEQIRYDRMVEKALRGVVAEALNEVAEHGLPGEHHFFLTFATQFPGVVAPAHLAERYPEEITVVLQHQFSGLEVKDGTVGVTLSFEGRNERLSIPLAAITTFADPSVNFVLQFQPVGEAAERAVEPAVAAAAPEPALAGAPDTAEKVVTLDRFRKK